MTEPPVTAFLTEGADALLRTFLTHGPCMILTIDAGYRILSINRVIEGLRVEDVIGTSALDYMPPDHHAAVRSAIDEVLRSGTPGHFETSGLVADGSFGWWVTHVLPITGHAGAARAVLLTTEVTAEKRAKEALRVSEERLRFALEATGEGLWDWNLVTHACYFSPAYHTMLGYEPGAIGPQVADVQALMHPDDEGVVKRSVEWLCHPGHFVMRFRLRSASGDYRWIESRGRTVQRDAAGQPLRAIGTHVDITERLRLEEALRRSEALLRSIIDGTADAIFVKDRQGIYLLVNQAACSIIGRSATEILGRDASAFMPPEAARVVMDTDRQLMAEGRLVSVHETLPWVDGQDRSFHTTKGPLFDDNAQVVGMFGISRDVTELLRQEAAQRQVLEENRSLLDTALESAELGTWDVDLADRSARYDERCRAMLGYSSTEMAPTMAAWLDLLHPDDQPAVAEAMRAHEAGETRLYESEHRLRHRDGHWVWVLARGKVLRNADGQPVRAVGTVLDITDRKRMATEGTALLKKIEALIRGLEPRGSAAGVLARSSDSVATPPKAHLTGRSREVIGLLAAGLTAGEIAERLGISKETANTHRRNLMRKLGLRNKAELIRYAIENDLSAPVPPKMRE